MYRKEYFKDYYKKNKEKILRKVKEYSKTPMGRALSLLDGYNISDRNSKRGKGDLTAKWIVDNIFSKPCVHCGKEGWDIIGCNRIDDSKPHTKDNVEPCCFECNIEYSTPQKQIDQIDMVSGEVIKTWNGVNEARRNGFSHCYQVANGTRNYDKGFIFKFIKASW